MVDDGEKFGVWPGTHAHVYEKGWLDRFFDRLLATEWLDLATLSDVVDRVEATAPVYLPTASYREMGEWALPLAAQRRLERAKHDLERLGGGDADADLLRGGFWRTFLVKYPEVADTYWKMLRLSAAARRALAGAPPGNHAARGAGGESGGRGGGGEDHPRRAGAEGGRARGAARLRRGPPRLTPGRLVRRRYDAARPRVALGARAPRAPGRAAWLHDAGGGRRHRRHVHPRRRGPRERREGGHDP